MVHTPMVRDPTCRGKCTGCNRMYNIGNTREVRDILLLYGDRVSFNRATGLPVMEINSPKECHMTIYFGGLAGERLAIFTECMRQEGKFCCHHLKVHGNPVDNKALLNFQNRGLLKAVGVAPKVYVVSETSAKKFTKKYPDIRVQYIKNKVHSPRKHCPPKVRLKSENRNCD